MAKHHRHSVWNAVFLKSNNSALWELYEALAIHFETRVTLFYRLYCKSPICSPQCNCEQDAVAFQIIGYE